MRNENGFSSVLLLGIDYRPIAILNWRKALVLVMEERVDVLEESRDIAHSPSTIFVIPSVIKLRHNVKIPFRTRLPLHRKNVLARDRGLCGYCGKSGASTIDHVIPRSRGGRHEWRNVVACHTEENHKKGDKLLSEIGWKLLWKLEAPLADHWIVMGLKGRAPDPSWVPYLPQTALSPA